MKRFLALALVVLGLAACQNDPEVINPVGGEVDYELTVAAPELGATRANVNMDSAKGAIDNTTDWSLYDVRYILEIYNEDGTTAAKERMVQIVDEYEPVVFKFRIVPHRTYKFVVFADFVEDGLAGTEYVNAGKHHVIGNTLADITIKDDAINDECTDAYFFSGDIEIKNALQNPIELTRPYAKLRVVTTDLDELNLDVDPAKVVVTYAAGTQPTTFNAITGVIGGANAAEQTFEFEYENLAKPYTTGKDAEAENMTLFADYILATDVDTPIQFKMDVYDENDDLIKSNTFSTDIPVHRNHLTTIIGNVLTTASEVMITIDDDFSNEGVEEEPHYKQVVLVNTAANLQEAIDNYVNGQTILFDNNIKGVVTLIQKEGVNFVIDGNGYKFDGTLQLDGDARAAGTDSITLKNINFETAESSLDFINAYKVYSGKNYNYLHNLTIENCTFKGSGNDSTVVALRTRSAYNIVVKNCEATDLHSFGQLTSSTDMLFEEVNINAGEGGFNFLSSTNGEVVINNCNIESTYTNGYGVRVDAIENRELTINNSTLKANAPVILRKAKASFTLYVNNSQLLESGDSKVVINGEAAKVIIDGKEAQFVTSTTDLATLLASIPAGQEATVVVPADNYTSFPASAMHEGITLLCDEGTVFEGTTSLNVNGATVVGATFDGANNKVMNSSRVDGTFKNCVFNGDLKNGYAGETVVFENCEFNGPDYALHFDGNATGVTNTRVILRNCVVNSDWRVAIGAAISMFEATDTKFNVVGFMNLWGKASFTNCEFTKPYYWLCNMDYATYTNCKFDGRPLVGSDIDIDDTIVDVDGQYYAEANNSTELSTAFNLAAAEYSPLNILVKGDVTGNVTAVQKENVEVVVEGNNHSYNGALLIDGKSSRFATAGLTIQNFNFTGDDASITTDAYINLGIKGDNNTRYTNNVTVKNCTFSTTATKDVVAVKSYTGGDRNVNIIGCTVNAGMHSLAQFTNIEKGLKFEGCQVYSKNGLNLNNTPTFDMNDCTFDTVGYAIRVGVNGSVNSTEKIFNISNSSLKSACDDGDAVIIFRENATYSTLNLTNTTIEGTTKVSGNTDKTTINGANL